MAISLRVAFGSLISGIRLRRAPGRRGGLPHDEDAYGLDPEHAEQDQVDQVRRGGEELDREGRDKRARGRADAGRERVGQRSAAPVEIEQPGPDGAQR